MEQASTTTADTLEKLEKDRRKVAKIDFRVSNKITGESNNLRTQMQRSD